MPIKVEHETFLTPGQVETFLSDGFVVVKGLLSRERVELIQQASRRVYRGEYRCDRRPSEARKKLGQFDGEPTINGILNARVLDQDLWDLSGDNRLASIAASLLRTAAVSVLEDALLDKPPHGLPVNAHQDAAYWSYSRSRNAEAIKAITCWMPLMEMRPEHGRLLVVRGSHRWGLAPVPKAGHGEGSPSIGEVDPLRGNEEHWGRTFESVRPPSIDIDVVDVDAPVGAGVFFHGLTFHGSSRNRSDDWRRACSLHFVADECLVDRRPPVYLGDETGNETVFSGLKDCLGSTHLNDQ